MPVLADVGLQQSVTLASVRRKGSYKWILDSTYLYCPIECFNNKNMVKIEKGQLLQSTAVLAGTYFENTTILIAEVNEQGALGFVINKSFNRQLNQLVEFSHCRAFPFFEGGPVDQEHLYVVHQRPDLIDNGVHISNSLFYGGNFQQVLQAINQQLINEAELKLFIGYCGWDTGELEAEIEEGSWLLKDEPAHQVITGKG